MANYSKTTNFGTKDTLPIGDSQKIIRGSEFDTEFDNIATAITSKLDSPASSANVNFLQSGATAVSRTAESKLRETLSIVDFGAVAGVDIAAALNAAITAAKVSGNADVFIPAGSWTLLTSPAALDNTTSLRIFGAGPNKTSIWVGANNVTVFSLTNVCARVTIDSMWIGSSAARTNTTAISVVGTSYSAPCSAIQIDNVKIQNINNPLVWTDVHQSFVSRVVIVQTVASAVTGNCMALKNIVTCTLRDCFIFATTGTFAQDCVLLLDDNDSVILDGFNVLDGQYGYRIRNAAGSTGTRLSRLINCYAESCTAAGFYQEGICRDLRLIGCHSAVNASDGFWISGGKSVSLTDCFSIQNNGHGYYIQSGSNIKLLGCEATNNSQVSDVSRDGIYVSTSNVRVIGCRSGDYMFTLANKQRYGLTIAAASDYVFEASNDLSGNTTGPLNYASTEANNQIEYRFQGSKTYDPGSLSDGQGETTTVTVSGARLGDYASASFSLNISGITLTAYVSANDTVTVRFQNESGGTVDLASGTLRAIVRKA